MQFLALLNIRRKHTYSSWRRTVGNKAEYVIRIPGFHGELTRKLTDDELHEFVTKSNREVKNALGDIGQPSIGTAVANIIKRRLNGRVEEGGTE